MGFHLKSFIALEGSSNLMLMYGMYQTTRGVGESVSDVVEGGSSCDSNSTFKT